MKGYRSRVAILLAAAAITFAGCSAAPAQGNEPTDQPPVTVHDGANPEVKVITLSERAAERLGLKTAPVTAAQGGLVIPYAAILYDIHGQAWVYEQTAARTFTRVPVDVAAIDGPNARLASGPDAGTLVVEVGVAELFGAETGVGEPE